VTSNHVCSMNPCCQVQRCGFDSRGSRSQWLFRCISDRCPKPPQLHLQPHPVEDVEPQQVVFSEGWQHDTCTVGGQHATTTGVSRLARSSCVRGDEGFSCCSVCVSRFILVISRVLSLSSHEVLTEALTQRDAPRQKKTHLPWHGEAGFSTTFPD